MPDCGEGCVAEVGYDYQVKKVEVPVGSVFGKLTVLGRSDMSRPGYERLRCMCECGVEAHPHIHNLRRGKTKSCGCIARDPIVRRAVKHGLSNTPTYISYRQMLARCLNPNAHAYKRYGGAGIYICERWIESFQNFLSDMGERPLGTSLDRIDNNGHYEPGNCRWATEIQQQRNRRSNKFVVVDGVRMTQAEAAEKLGVTQVAVCMRVKAGVLARA